MSSKQSGSFSYNSSSGSTDIKQTSAIMDDDERIEELSSITAIFPELTVESTDPFKASLKLPVAPTSPLLVRFIPQASDTTIRDTYATVATNGSAYVERDVYLSHLPPLCLEVKLPDSYPTHLPPKVQLETEHDWLPRTKLEELQQEVEKLWEEYGRCQILFSYIDFLQQAAENGFSLDEETNGCLTLSEAHESVLVNFDRKTKKETFDAGSYDCGVCLEPKKGSACYRLERCGHVFCRQCLQDFYNNAINEGDVVNIRCLDPGCGKESGVAKQNKRKTARTLHPRELLGMGVEDSMVRRYVEMKRKKKLESDKTTVYCPRSWCQGPARSTRYPPIPANLADYAESSESESDADSPTTKRNATQSRPDPSDRLAVCEKCSLAFCRTCYHGWHGPYVRCHPRNPNELSEEEKASYDYIRLNTSPCPTCSSPTQKTMGCNHMKCFQCNSHFCYLCGAWLMVDNPYQHFNQPGKSCYQRLWELEEGDEGAAPQDGRGFAGNRGWEQLALEVARQADEEEAEAAARAAQTEEDAIVVPVINQPAIAAVNEEPLVAGMEQIRLDHQHAPPRRPRNPFAGPPAGGRADAVRAHERAGQQGQRQNNARRAAAGPRRAPPADAGQQRQEEELRRFLELAERDEEDGWDSDELGDEEGWVIR